MDGGCQTDGKLEHNYKASGAIDALEYVLKERIRTDGIRTEGGK